MEYYLHRERKNSRGNWRSCRIRNRINCEKWQNRRGLRPKPLAVVEKAGPGVGLPRKKT